MAENFIKFLGHSSGDVTGSQFYIEWKGKKILLECGLTQANNIEKDWLDNSSNFKFKPSQLDYCFVGHLHGDHFLKVPKLYADGYRGSIVMPKNSKAVGKIMMDDCCRIIKKDCEFINKRYNRNYKPYFDESHVDMAHDAIIEYGYNEWFKLDENISFMFKPSQHIISASQLLLRLKDKNKHIDILYTSDLGNVKYGESLYASKFEPFNACNILIGESTYSSTKRSGKNKDREKDLEKIKTCIDQFVITNKKQLLCPVFALSRCQQMLTHIYDMYKDSKEDFDVIIDSPMSCKITKEFLNIIDKKDKNKYSEILQWNRLKFVETWEESEAFIQSGRSAVILSASGMMNAGRVISHMSNIIEDEKCGILLCGYASPYTLAGVIKEGKKKYIRIGDKEYRNKAQLIELKSMSSHMQADDLLRYYSSIKCNSVYLVHGGEDRYELAENLQNEYNKNGKSTKVYIGERDYKLTL